MTRTPHNNIPHEVWKEAGKKPVGEWEKEFAKLFYSEGGWVQDELKSFISKVEQSAYEKGFDRACQLYQLPPKV